MSEDKNPCEEVDYFYDQEMIAYNKLKEEAQPDGYCNQCDALNYESDLDRNGNCESCAYYLEEE